MTVDCVWFDRDKAQTELMKLFTEEINKAFKAGYDAGYEHGTEEGFLRGDRYASA